MHYTLQGKIARSHPYSLDKTLSVPDTAAEAKATGEAIENVRKNQQSHSETKSNPHGVTKAQVGLGNVDNTPDLDKPVSTAQQLAIEEAKREAIVVVEDVRTFAEEVKTSADNAQTAADNAQTSADNAKTAADNAQTSADNAQATADGKAQKVTFTVAVPASGWTGTNAPYTQTVAVQGITENDNPHYGIVYSSDYDTKVSEKESFAYVDDLDTAKDSVTFTCLEEKPTVDMTIQMEVFR